MSLYTRKSILAWFHKTLGVDAQPAKDEVLTSCPECGSDVFYFNIRKLVGICHKASCGYTPTLEDLIETIGFSPNADGHWEREEKEEVTPEVILPGWPIAQMINGQLMTTNQIALEYLWSRGLTSEVVMNWGVTSDGERVYVPIISEGILANYNSRILPGSANENGKKYLYCKGVPTSKYILGWEESRLWPRLSFVENTFVSLWLRHALHCSTTFGSNISDVQADGIRGSDTVRTVAVLWDENAERQAERGVHKLWDRGIKAAYWSILGQPDDYPKETVIKWAELVHEAAQKGKICVDLREECHESMETYS